MLLYKELNLPKPIVDDHALEEIVRAKSIDGSYNTIVTEPQQYLSQDILDAFGSVGVTPQFMVIFGDATKSQFKTFLHSDITYQNNTWTKMPFGINWDLNSNNTSFNWWNVHGSPEIFPEPRDADFPPVVYGIHHKYRRNRETSDFTLIQSYTIKPLKATLVRTDIPHQICYNTNDKPRLCISVRFSVTDIASWTHAVEIFQPFFDN